MDELPGIESADLTNIVPLSGGDNGGPFWIGSRQPASLQEAPHALYFWTGPDYLKTMEIPLLQGRFFTPDDQISSGKVVVIDSVLAHTFFPGQNPVGQTLTVAHWGAARIVGVVGHVHNWGLHSCVPTAGFNGQQLLPHSHRDCSLDDSPCRLNACPSESRLRVCARSAGL
jgi:hypothetical protein